MGKTMYWIFREDGKFSLNSSSAWTDSRGGTYKVSGNKITGNGSNASAPSPQTMQINFTINGNTLTGNFHEDWGGGKNITVEATKQ
ncbi:MAG: hypothetical protein FWG05_03845 [Kiritimatiellaeota bacterium]|nr:hypothetical protein [Kiritimatiellota bacterium]